MTEVPEHLLARSKSARAKAAGGGGDAGDAGGSQPPATPGEAPGTGAAASAVEPVGAAAVPAPVEEPPKPVPAYVAAAQQRKRVPKFAIPVLAALPVWALVYAGTMTVGEGDLDPVLALGETVYSQQCASCHGSQGQGGTGRPLDEVLLTFPDPADHDAWIVNGSPPAGEIYGDPNRPGGPRISRAYNGTPMPGFPDLSEEELVAVRRYEREVIGGEEAQVGAEGELTSEDGETEPRAGRGASTDGESATSNAEQQGGEVGGESNASGNSDDAAPTSDGGETEGGVAGGGGTGADTGGSSR